jgi:hypothetical protein
VHEEDTKGMTGSVSSEALGVEYLRRAKEVDLGRILLDRCEQGATRPDMMLRR